MLVIYRKIFKKNKLTFMCELSKFCSNSIEPILTRGDFNIIRYAKEWNKKKISIDILGCLPLSTFMS